MKILNTKPFSSPIYITSPLFPDLSELSERLEEIWDSGWLTNNACQHSLLEEKLREFLGVSHLSLFNNGTIGLLVACRSLGLSGEVITTPFTFPATPHSLTWNNIRPIFCDIDPVTLALDPDKIEAAVTPETTGILAVHVFGTPCDVVRIQEVANRHGLKVIYDAAHAFGVQLDNIGIGNFGDITMFSFHATKMFHTAEGGALCFRDKGLKTKVDLLKNFGIKDEEEVVMPGINGKMNEFQAALGLVVLNYVSGEMQKRKHLVEVYRTCLKNVEGITYVEDSENVAGNYQYFIIKIDEKKFGVSRDFVYEQFKEYNVFTRKYFYPLCSEYEHYRHLPSAAPANLPSAHEVAQQVLSLPLYGELSSDAVVKICDILLGFRSV